MSRGKPPLRAVARLLPALAVAGSAIAATPPGGTLPDFSGVLPPPERAIEAIEASPVVAAAREQVGIGEARERRLRAGQYEWEVTALTQSRTDGAGRTWSEQQYELQRRFRLPGKAGLDRRLGAAAAATGDSFYGEARHEAARRLLAEWMDWQRTAATSRRLAATAEVLAQQARSIERRLAAGDAARVDLRLAEAERDLAQARLLEARRAEAAARLALGRDFPLLSTPLPPEIPAPAVVEGDESAWIALILEHDHAVELAENQLQAAELALERARRERVPDPLLGMQYSHNFDQNREVVAFRMTVPLGVAGRSADVAAARGAANAAQAQRDAARLTSEQEARAALLNARSLHQQWQRVAASSQTAEETAAALFRGYELGEYDFATVLTARRQAAEAGERADAARVDAWEASARVVIDAHVLWAPAEGDHEH